MNECRMNSYQAGAAWEYVADDFCARHPGARRRIAADDQQAVAARTKRARDTIDDSFPCDRLHPLRDSAEPRRRSAGEDRSRRQMRRPRRIAAASIPAVNAHLTAGAILAGG